MDSGPYYPPLITKIKVDETKFTDLILDCVQAVGKLDGMLTYNPHRNIVRSFLTAEEVLTSASLEVKGLNFEQYLEKLFSNQGYKPDDMVEMRFLLNYYQDAVDRLKERGFSLDFLNDFNQKLVENRNLRPLSARDMFRERLPWLYYYREKEDIWDQRLYLSSTPEKIEELMHNLDNFIRRSKLHPLPTAAIAYGQLAMLHPWDYANGRTTGALIPFLFNALELTTGYGFYLSSIFSKHKETYYNQIAALFLEKDWQQWITFFLTNVKRQALKSQKKVDHILNFYSRIVDHTRNNISNNQNVFRYLNILLTHPIFMHTRLERSHGLSTNLLSRYIYHYRDHGYLTKDDRKRYQNYMFSELYALFAM